jgi:uroporphyrinogen-III synthase
VPEIPSRGPALQGVRVLVTRPRDQAENLARLIEGQGGEAIRFPVIEIAEPQDTRKLRAIIGRLEDFSLAIFISPNAVRRGMHLINSRRGALPPNLRVACVGSGSAHELSRFGIGNVIAPDENFDSEALLELSDLQQVEGQKIVIFRGAGGRELLANTLKARGATVEYAECYRRVRPHADFAPLLRRWERGEVDIVCITSEEGLRNLYAMSGQAGRVLLLQTPIIVVSPLQATLCRALGFKNEVRMAARASDVSMLDAIIAWQRQQKTL